MRDLSIPILQVGDLPFLVRAVVREACGCQTPSAEFSCQLPESP